MFTARQAHKQRDFTSHKRNSRKRKLLSELRETAESEREKAYIRKHGNITQNSLTQKEYLEKRFVMT